MLKIKSAIRLIRNSIIDLLAKPNTVNYDYTKQLIKKFLYNIHTYRYYRSSNDSIKITLQ